MVSIDSLHATILAISTHYSGRLLLIVRYARMFGIYIKGLSYAST